MPTTDLEGRSPAEGVSASVAGVRGIRPFPLSSPEADLLALVLASGHNAERLRLTDKQNHILEGLAARLWSWRDGTRGRNRELFALPQAPRNAWGRFCAEADRLEAGGTPAAVTEPASEPDPDNLELAL